MPGRTYGRYTQTRQTQEPTPGPSELQPEQSETESCNDPTIGSYNNYNLSPNGIPSGNQRWNGLIYLVYIKQVSLGHGLGGSE